MVITGPRASVIAWRWGQTRVCSQHERIVLRVCILAREVFLEKFLACILIEYIVAREYIADPVSDLGQLLLLLLALLFLLRVIVVM